MKIIQIFGTLLIVSLSFGALAQENKALTQQQMDSIAQASDEIYHIVEVMPQFPGGEDSLKWYLQKNTRMPQADVVGNVFVKFVVEKDGSLSSIEVVRGIGSGCDEEAIRVIQSMPKWIPGTHRKIPMRTYMICPVSFNTITY